MFRMAAKYLQTHDTLCMRKPAKGQSSLQSRHIEYPNFLKNLKAFALTKTGLCPHAGTFIHENKNSNSSVALLTLNTHKNKQDGNLTPTRSRHEEGSLQAPAFGSRQRRRCHSRVLISHSTALSQCFGTGEAQNQWDTPLILNLCCEC